MGSQESCSFGFFLCGFQLYLAGLLCSWWVAWRCFRQRDIPFGLVWLLTYPLLTFPLWLTSGRPWARRWGANRAISWCALLLAWCLLNWALAVAVLLVPHRLWESWAS